MLTQFLSGDQIGPLVAQEPNFGTLSDTGGIFQKGNHVEGGCIQSDGLCISVILDTTGVKIEKIICPSFEDGLCLRNKSQCPNTLPTVSLASMQDNTAGGSKAVA